MPTKYSGTPIDGKEVSARQSSVGNIGHEVVARETCQRIEVQQEFTRPTEKGSDQSNDSCKFQNVHGPNASGDFSPKGIGDSLSEKPENPAAGSAGEAKGWIAERNPDLDPHSTRYTGFG